MEWHDLVPQNFLSFLSSHFGFFSLLWHVVPLPFLISTDGFGFALHLLMYVFGFYGKIYNKI